MTPEQKKEFEQLKADRDQFLAERDAAVAALEESKKGTPLEKVPGKFKAEWNSPKGKKTRTIGFVDGHTKLRLKGEVVLSKDVITVANGGKLPKEVAEKYSWLDEEVAAKHLTHLAKIKYSFLKDVK